MQFGKSTILIGACALSLFGAPACTETGTDGTGGAGGSAVTPAVYKGTYEVPVTADLAAAAIYDVPEVEWTVTGGSVELHYDLPMGLVGQKLRVDFQGTVDAGAGTADLLGKIGDAQCTVAADSVSCLEHMPGLKPLTPDLAVVEQLAATEFSGPASMRVDVAKQFSVDPIGIVRVDLTSPVAVEPEKPENPG